MEGLTFEDISVVSVKEVGHFAGPASCIKDLTVRNVSVASAGSGWRGCGKVDLSSFVSSGVSPPLTCKGCAGLKSDDGEPRTAASPAASSFVRGVNYVPSYARNDVQIWHDFDEAVVDRELGFARDLANGDEISASDNVFKYARMAPTPRSCGGSQPRMCVPVVPAVFRIVCVCVCGPAVCACVN